ncbi:FGGY-family carbohydrate kinase [Pseudomonas sp. HR96]|uniref:FGGY-family carbohydrate kinase n=1 Tax=Pseudomonas sp. HR96 TaxID=1027966 RepID=UPI002A75ADEA|nr:FGGY-family carbohydrate kinase [Pseudomonas sp. HR96]WPP01148.1 FGGY-family carbohydrate kinase [Pseudomonas sp. HR96]
MTLLLGLDFGTGGVRAGLYDLHSHKLVQVAEAPYATSYPELGWAEQDPDQWWSALGSACRQLMAAAGHPAVAAVCVATTASTVVAAGADGRPLRPALLWMDCRAGAESTRTAQTAHPMMNPGGDAVEWLVPKAMWLARHEPQVYAAAAHICEAVDWLNFKLTGRWVASRLNASCKWNYDTQRQRFPVELYEQLGIPELADKLPPEVIAVGGRIAPLSGDAANHLGLTRDTLVAQGGIDAHMAMLSAGTTGAGELLFIGGTSVVQLMHTPERIDVPGIWGPYPDALLDGHWLMEGGQVSAGSILNWLAQKMFGLDAAGHQQLIQRAMALKPGATGLLVLDYWMGNRTPYRAPDMRGAIMGLSLNHDRHDLYRASVEAIALGSANIFHTWRAQGIEITRVVAAGGFQNNPLWLQATVDATGVPFEMVAHDNLTLIGTAAAAACALGEFATLQEAATDFTTVGKLIEPDPHAHDCYVELLGRYRDATQSVAPISCRPAPSSVGTRRPAA